MSSSFSSSSPPVLSSLSFSSLSYRKLVLHCLSYPSSPVVGLLIVQFSPDSPSLRVLDCVPLFHSPLISPLVEVSLRSAEFYASSLGGSIGGLYSANELFDRKELMSATLKLADRIAELEKRFPPSIFLVDNSRLDHLTEPIRPCGERILFDQTTKQWNANQGESSNGTSSVTVDAGTLEEIPTLLNEIERWKIEDFESHCEDITNDWRNPQIQ